MRATNRFAESSLCTFDHTASAFAASTDVEYQFCVSVLVDHVIVDVISIQRIRDNHVTRIFFGTHYAIRYLVRFVLDIKSVGWVRHEVLV